MGDRSGVCGVLVGKPEGPRHILEDNIKMDLQEVGWGPLTGLVWLRRETDGGRLHVNAIMYFRVP